MRLKSRTFAVNTAKSMREPVRRSTDRISRHLQALSALLQILLEVRGLVLAKSRQFGEDVGELPQSHDPWVCHRAQLRNHAPMPGQKKRLTPELNPRQHLGEVPGSIRSTQL